MGTRRPLPTKTCAVCGREFSWRKAWERDWDQVRHCSAHCRRRRAAPRSRALEAAILELLDSRPKSASICPSEVAREVDPEGWRDLMEDTRSAARRLVASGQAEITQHGRPVDPSTARGPIRIRRPR